MVSMGVVSVGVWVADVVGVVGLVVGSVPLSPVQPAKARAAATAAVAIDVFIVAISLQVVLLPSSARVALGGSRHQHVKQIPLVLYDRSGLSLKRSVRSGTGPRTTLSLPERLWVKSRLRPATNDPGCLNRRGSLNHEGGLRDRGSGYWTSSASSPLARSQDGL